MRTEKRKFFYGYVIVGVSFLVNMIAGGTMYSYGVFFKPLLAEFGWTRAVTSSAPSLRHFVFGVLGVLGGRLNDRFGPRVVVTACGIFLGAGYLLMTQISTIWQLYLVVAPIMKSHFLLILL